MKDQITFEKGLFPQIDQTTKIPGTYLDALNMMRDESGALYNEIGTKLVHILPTGFEFVGYYNLGDDIIFAATDGTTSTISILDDEDNYTTIIQNSVLGFKKEYKVEIEGRFNHRGERVIYIVGEKITPRRINLDNLPTTNFDKETNMFLEYNLPKVELNTIFSGGKVRSGVYQFAARLVTGSNNVTGFGPISGMIPVGTGNIEGDRRDYDGGAPQSFTNNAISLTIKNIDRAFVYVEPCVITYIGESNVVKIRTLPRVPIGSDSVQILYSSEDDEGEVILESELSMDSVSYNSAKHILQKDNTLLLAGLEEVEDTTDWQSIANQIKIKYVEHKLEFYEPIKITNPEGKTIDDILRENVNATLGEGPWIETSVLGSMTDYKNPKVCEKFMSYKRDEVYSFTFTPVYTSGRRGDAFHIPALDPVSSDMLDYVEVEGSLTYPDNFGNLSGKKIRYHKMPSSSKSPFYIEQNNKAYIVALGLKFELPDGDWKDKLSGYILGREDRRGKETILSQGVIKHFYRTNGNNYITPLPSFSRLRITDTEQANITGDGPIDPYAISFHSPDLITDEKEFIPYKLRKVATMQGTVKFANTQRNRAKFNCANLVDAVPKQFHNNMVYGLTGDKTLLLAESTSPTDNYWENGRTNIVKPVLNGYAQAAYRRILDTYVLKTETDCRNFEPYEVIEWYNDPGKSEDDRESTYIFNVEKISPDGKLQYDLGLYEVLLNNPIYYGNIYSKESIPICDVTFNVPQVDPRNGYTVNSLSPICFGGDTFISKYAYMFKDTVPYHGSIGKYQDVPKFSNIIYFFVESYNNYNYRHFMSNEEGESLTTPYYPKFKTLINDNVGILDLPVAMGHSELYNKQYSAQNTLKTTYVRGIDEERIFKFDNRIAYSATSIEGERFDAYTLFLPGNIHDIPKQFGNISSMFVQGSDLYVHTERSLWRAFYNTLATQATSEGDIVLGNGGAFPRPSVPIVTINGGYAGCLNSDASVGTPVGHVFFDANSGKLFMLNDGLMEISNPAVFDLLRKEAYKQKATIAYDTGRKRIILHTNNVTISYRPDLNSFDSRHSYRTKFATSRNISDYLINANSLHKYDDTKVGEYFGVRHDSFVKLHSVVHPNISKRYTSIEAVTTAKNPQTGLHLPFGFFDTFKAYSMERNTGHNSLRMITEYTEDLETLGRVFVYKANNKFRFAIPPDIVYDIHKNIHDTTNLVTHSIYHDEDKVLLPDMIDNHLVLELTIDNINSQKLLKVNSFIINFDENIT